MTGLKPREIQFAGMMGGRHSLDELQTTLDVLRKGPDAWTFYFTAPGGFTVEVMA